MILANWSGSLTQEKGKRVGKRLRPMCCGNERLCNTRLRKTD